MFILYSRTENIRRSEERTTGEKEQLETAQNEMGMNSQGDDQNVFYVVEMLRLSRIIYHSFRIYHSLYVGTFNVQYKF